MGSRAGRLVAAGVVLVLAGTPVAASACALWCPPGTGHEHASSRESAPAGAPGQSPHEACREHEAEPPASAATGNRVAPAPSATVADDDCCTVDRVGAELPRVLDRHDVPLASRIVTVPRLPALRRAAARAPDIPRALPRLSRTSVLRI